ncbi:MAG TPA: hypothetical protein VK654_16780 [Nitrospirota bacterium]|nr:hypothetical protein [Nitrospirota bacterium]
MRKIILCVIVAVGLCGTPAAAQEQTNTGFLDWIRGLQKKISQVAPKKSVGVTNSVAGVRGAKEDAALKLYWKSKRGDEPVTEEELAEFKEALDFAAKGDKARAIHELQEFLKMYPDSALVPDAKKTLDLAIAEPKAEQKAEAGKKEDPKKEDQK